MRTVAAIVALAGLALAQKAGVNPAAKTEETVPALGVAAGTGVFPAAAPMETKLSNGIRVHLLARPGVSTVHGLIRSPGGSASDPAGKTGLTLAALSAWRAGGSSDLPGGQFGDRLAEFGAAIEPVVDVTWSGFRFRCLREDFGMLSGMLGALVRSPAFEAEAVDGAVGRIRTSVGLRNLAPVPLAQRQFRLLVQGPAGLITRQIEYGHLDNIGSEDFARFARTAWSPDAITIALEADLEASSATAALEEPLGSWKPKAVLRPPPVRLSAAGAPGVYYSEQRQMRESEFIVGHIAGEVTDASYPPLWVAAEMLGGEARSRLASIAKEKRLWDFRPSARWEAGIGHPGYFEVRGTVSAPFTTDAIRASLGAMERLRTETARSAEVEAARYRVLRALAGGLAQPGGSLTATEGFRVDALWKAIAAVTPASVREAAAKHWRPKEATIVVLGSQTLFDHPLDTLGYEVKALDVSIPGPRPFEKCTDEEMVSGGKTLLDQMRKALGGDRLAGVKSLEQVMKGRGRRGRTWAPVSAWERWLADGVYRQESETEESRDVYFYNGEIGWHGRDGGLIRALPGFLIQRIRGNIFRYLFRLASAGSDVNSNVCKQGDGFLQVTDDQGNGVRIYLDPDTNLPARLSYQAEAANGVATTVEESLGNWRDVNGILWPHSVAIKENGRREQEYEVEKVVLNGALDQAELERKP